MDGVDDQLRQGHDRQRRAAHRHGEHQRKGPVAELGYLELVDALGQPGGTYQEEDDIGGQIEQHLMGAGVLHPREEHHAQGQLAQGQRGQGEELPPEAEPEPEQDEHEVQQTSAHYMIIQLGDKAAHIVVRIAVGIIEGQNLADHGPEQGHHGHHGTQAEQHKVANPAQGQRLVPGFGELPAADEKEQRIGEVIAHYKVQIPPAGQDDGRSGEEDEGEPTRLQLLEPVVQRQQQDGKGEDEAEPVRLGQHGAHPQKREGQHPRKADEEMVEPVLHMEHLANLHGQARQQDHQGRQHAEHLRESVAVAGAGRQAEGELGEEGDEVGVVIGKGTEDVREPRRRALGKGGLGAVLLDDVVDVVPRIDELPPPQRPVEVEHRCGPEADEDGPVEEVQFHMGHPQHPQRPVKEHAAAPQAHQREEGPPGGEDKADDHQRQRAEAKADAALAPRGEGGFCLLGRKRFWHKTKPLEKT